MEEKAPLISVIVPVYNVESYLNQCIESVVHQTYSSLEIILVNDGSTDSSPDICEKWRGLDNRIKLIHKKNGGLSSARNAALDITNAPYVTFVDSDDYIHPRMIEFLYKKLIELDADFSFCGFEKTYEDLSEFPDKIGNDATQKLNRRGLFAGLYGDKRINYVCVCGKLYKRNIFDGLRFIEGRINEDEAIAHEIISRVDSAAVSYSPLYYYRQTQSSITRGKYRLKNLDCFYAKEERLDYFIKHNSEFELDARKDIFWTAIYNLQRALLDLNGDELETVANRVKEILNKHVYGKVSISEFDGLDMIWFILSRLSVVTACKLRNMLKVGG